jgi:hypothetical protein
MSAKKWDKNERRIAERRTGWCIGECAVHDLIQDETKEHRETVCSKISNLKSDYLRDIDEVKSQMNGKASHSDVRGLMKLVSVLVAICCLIVAGQAIWLKSDISGITSSIQRLNIRITETVNDRVKTDMEQSAKLETIDGKLGTINWRLTELESYQKSEKK